MPAYNAEAFLDRSVASVRAQSHADWELLIVDDHSTDGTGRLAQRYAALDGRIRSLQMPVNAGVAAARNAGIDAAQGSVIAFLDCDDWWHERKLELQIACMQRTGARVSYASYQRIAEDGTALSRVSPPAQVTYRDMLKSNHIGNLTGMYERGLSDVRFRAVGHEDYAFWLELVHCAGSAHGVEYPEPLAYYLVRNNSLSGSKLRALRWQWRIYRDNEGLGPFSAVRYMAHYGWNALRKRQRFT
jgi:glycosyltransferase involved in cell wall biosynthesis